MGSAVWWCFSVQRAALGSGMRCLTAAFIPFSEVFTRASSVGHALALLGTRRAILAVLEQQHSSSGVWAVPPVGFHVPGHLLSNRWPDPAPAPHAWEVSVSGHLDRIPCESDGPIKGHKLLFETDATTKYLSQHLNSLGSNERV